MFKINILLIFVLFSYNVLAMDKPVDCNIKIDFEKSIGTDYLYTGYGELTCSDEASPSTIFSAIRSTGKNSALEKVNKFTLTTELKQIDVLAYIFQTYNVKSRHNKLYLIFDGNEYIPPTALGTSLKSNTDGKDHNQTLINLLPGSELIIEQDQFWMDEEI